MQLFRTTLLAFTLLLLASPALAQEKIEDIFVVCPSWGTFTNKDGTGLYYEILDNLFALYDLSVRHEFVPSPQALNLVRTNKADIKIGEVKPIEGLVLSKHPMYQGAYHVFFNKENIGEWVFPTSLEGRSLVYREGYYLAHEIPAKMELIAVKSGVSALGMVVLGRVDFYVDDKNLILESLNETKRYIEREAFDIQPVGTRSYFPVFNTTERGRRIMELYEEGMQTLHESGMLRTIFEKWGHPYPAYSF